MPETDKEKRVSKRSEGCQFSPWASGTARTAARVTPGAGAPGLFRWSGAVRHHARDAFEAVPAMHVYFAARVRPVTAAYSSEARHMKLLGSMLMSRWMPAVLVLAFVALLAVISIALPANNDEGVWLYIGKMWVQEGLLPMWRPRLKTPDLLHLRTPFGVGICRRVIVGRERRFTCYRAVEPVSCRSAARRMLPAFAGSTCRCP